MSANQHGIIAATGRAHCQRKVAFFVSRLHILDHQLWSIIGDITMKYVQRTMKNGAGVNLTPPDLLALDNISFNFYHSFITNKATSVLRNT